MDPDMYEFSQHGTRDRSRTRSPVARAAEGILRQSPPEIARRSPAKLRCVHRWIEEQAGHRPEAVAFVASGVSLTYGELNARANRLARRLRAMGVGPEVLVGLCAGRSARTVVGLLAILKAGGAYVPLDPAYPAERIAFMLQTRRSRFCSPKSDCATNCQVAKHGSSAWTRNLRPAIRKSRRISMEERAGEPGLCDLHLGLDGQAQRGADHAWCARQLAAVDAGCCRSTSGMHCWQ